jgi:hypothetical protein
MKQTLSFLLVLVLILSVAIAQEPPLGDTCDIYAIRRDPRDPTRNQKWLTPAEAVILDIPGHGQVYVAWDEVNENLYIQGRDLQLFQTVGNVLRIDVIPREEELP